MESDPQELELRLDSKTVFTKHTPLADNDAPSQCSKMVFRLAIEPKRCSDGEPNRSRMFKNPRRPGLPIHIGAIFAVQTGFSGTSFCRSKIAEASARL
jgi:hypothetical protein